MHPVDDYTYTGETTTNWALTVSDKASFWDLTGGAKIRLKTQNGLPLPPRRHQDGGRQVLRERGRHGESSSWIERDYVFSDLHWRNLLMTDTPTNASNRRQPDPKRVPIIPTSKGHAGPDEGGRSGIQRSHGRRLDSGDVSRRVVRPLREDGAALGRELSQRLYQRLRLVDQQRLSLDRHVAAGP